MRSPENATGDHMTPYLRAANVGDGKLLLDDVKTMNFSPTEQARYALAPGDVLVTEGSGSRSTVGASASWPGSSTPTMFQNTLVRLRALPHIEPRYLYWWSRHAYISGLYAEISQGLAIWHLSAERVRTLPFSAPDRAEQRRIAEFLDDQVARLDCAVALQSAQQTLASRRRQSFLTELTGVAGSLLAVVEGTRSSQHAWPTRKLSHVLAATIPGGTPSTNDPNYWTDPPSGVPWISIGDMREGDTTAPPLKHVTERGLEAARLRVAPAGSVLFAMYASVGKTSIAATVSVWNQAILGLVPGPSLRSRYLLHWLELCRTVLTAITRSSTQDNLNAEQVRSLHLPLPDLKVQDGIISVIGESDRVAASLSSLRERQVTLLNERKQALITAAVTGQFDVTTARAVA
jgi:type I restriction enzyme S subunit